MGGKYRINLREIGVNIRNWVNLVKDNDKVRFSGNSTIQLLCNLCNTVSIYCRISVLFLEGAKLNRNLNQYP